MLEVVTEFDVWLEPPEWMRDGACNEHADQADDWFATTAADAFRRAQAVCTACLVQRDCLAYAIAENITDGVWGGATPKQRKELVASGKLTAALIAQWGVRAMYGLELERDAEVECLRFG